METVAVRTDAVAVDMPAPTARGKFIVLGGPVASIPGMDLRGAIGSPCAAIVLLKRVDPAELADVLARAPDPAVPIADFSANDSLRHDFVGSSFNAESAAAMSLSLSPIWRRLEEIPYREQTEDRAGLTVLRLAYSRDKPVQAALDPDYPLTVQYPLIGEGNGARQQLESLANQDLLRRRHFTRTHACGRCSSTRLNVYEACPGCGGSDLVEEVLVHHYRCGCQQPQSNFIQGDLLVCPKCRRELRHLGVDYGKPGKSVVCRICGAVNSEPLVHFACLDCAAVTPSESAAEADWYHYDLTAKGLSALQEGRLPRLEFVAQRQRRAQSPREFALLAAQEMRAARLLQRPFSIARVSFPNIDAMRRDLGLPAIDAAFRHAVDAALQTVLAADFVSTGTDTSIVIGFPQTAAADVRLLENELRKNIQDTVVAPLDIAIDVAEGDAVIDMLTNG